MSPRDGLEFFRCVDGRKLDHELRQLAANDRPRERLVQVDDVVRARAVSHDLEDVAPSAIDLGQRDERAAEVVSAPIAKPERIERLFETIVGVVGRPDLAV